MQKRAKILSSTTFGHQQMPGEALMSQLQFVTESTVNDSTLGVAGILAGVINRTASTQAYSDTLPTVSQLLAAEPNLSTGDSFTFIIRNTIAFANTIVAGTGWTLGANTAIAASLVREYLVTIGAAAPAKNFSCTTVNGTKVLSVISDSDLKSLVPGMVLSGTGITAGTLIVAVNPDNNTITTDTNSTADGTNISLAANPTATLTGVRSSTL